MSGDHYSLVYFNSPSYIDELVNKYVCYVVFVGLRLLFDSRTFKKLRSEHGGAQCHSKTQGDIQVRGTMAFVQHELVRAARQEIQVRET